jgi:hypothetical protein
LNGRCTLCRCMRFKKATVVDVVVGTEVDIRPGGKNYYGGMYGVVVKISDGQYHVTGGSIGSLVPVFYRRELKIRRKPS